MSKSKKVVKCNSLAEGEVTGHCHRLQSSTVYELEDGVREFSAPKGDVLTHEEHKTIEIPAGNYLSDKVNEYDYDAEEAKKVQD
jgi:hypothetical protein